MCIEWLIIKMCWDTLESSEQAQSTLVHVHTLVILVSQLAHSLKEDNRRKY